MKQPGLISQKLKILCLSVLIMTGIFSVAFADDFRYDSHKKRDPFVALEGGLGGSYVYQGDFRLEGVILDQVNGSYAIVNGEVVKEGTSINDYLLKKIGANRVIFEKDGEEVEVVLREDDELLKNR